MDEYKIVDAKITVGPQLRADQILPFEITHGFDEPPFGEECSEIYNYLVYKFRDGNNYVWARAYLSSIEEVSLFGPFESEQVLHPVISNEFVGKVVDYFKQRFLKIDHFKLDSEQGYETIWRGDSR